MPNCSTLVEFSPKSPKSKTLITSFLPRQLLINSKSTTTNMTLKQCDSTQSRAILLQSISQFLEKNGFSKTLKYFRKEAQLQDDGGDSFNVEEVCFDYLKSRTGAKEERGSDQTDFESAKNSEKIEDKGEIDIKNSEQATENGTIDGADAKSKKKKKSKNAVASSEQAIEETQLKSVENAEETPSSLPSEPAKKSKDKRKKHKDEAEDLDKAIQEKQTDVDAVNVEKKEKKGKKEKKEKHKDESGLQEKQSIITSEIVEKKEKKEKKGKKEKKEKDQSNIKEVNVVEFSGEEKKESKKRKNRSSEENGADHVEEETFDDSKRRKIDNSDQPQPPKTPNGSANGIVEKSDGEKSQKLNKTKEINGSAEPRTAAKAFQRVKPEDVEFADERLQDNSYWAKDGADSGYGAKAQEVLGQVRGRDFRHEKTKKKRGSYRGGQIDLNTHSVKFQDDSG